MAAAAATPHEEKDARERIKGAMCSMIDDAWSQVIEAIGPEGERQASITISASIKPKGKKGQRYLVATIAPRVRSPRPALEFEVKLTEDGRQLVLGFEEIDNPDDDRESGD